jgi:hypothetical protein
MKKICFFIIIHVFNLWLASPLCFAAEEELVDEGWRLHKELKIFFSDVTMDFSGEHYEMAHILLPPPQPQSSGENSTKEEKKVRCLMRFTPLINTEKGIERRETIRLTQEIFEHAPCNQSKLPFNEIGFLSGMYNSGKRNIEHGLLKIEPGYLSLIPQYQCNNYISNSFAVRLVQRTYMNPKRLNDSIKSRYPDNTPICFERGNYKKIYEANDVTKRNIKELIQSSEKMIEDITCFIMDGDLESVSSCVSSNEKKFIDFSANTKMLSYVCAEQAALDFLTSKKVQEYLRKLVCLDSLYGGSDKFSLFTHALLFVRNCLSG